MFAGVWAVSQSASGSEPEQANPASLIDQIDDLGAVSTSTWSDEFGGVWYVTRGDPTGGIEVGFTSGATEKVTQLAEQFTGPELIAIEVPKSQEEITQEMRVVIEDREQAKEEAGPLAAIKGGLFDMDADLKTGEILVMMPEVTPEVQQLFAETYPYRFRFVESSLGNFGSCNSRKDCTPQLRGGLQARNQATPYGQEHCSTGFTVWANNKTQILSAAHCSAFANRNNASPPFEERWNGPSTNPFGFVVKNSLFGAVDAERIAFRAGYVGRGWIYKNDNAKEWPIQSVGYWPSVGVGATICRVGNTTGYSCGEVVGKNFSPTKFINSAEKYVRTDGCSGRGDSGGAWFRVNKAWGIHAGWVDGDGDPQCDDDPMQSYFGAMNFALNAMNAGMVFYNP